MIRCLPATKHTGLSMSSAKSLSGLMKWLDRDGWREVLIDVVEEHFEPGRERGLDSKALMEMLGEPAASNLWGCAFEDFLTRVDEDDRNVVDDYLKRRGWKETGLTRKYMKALRWSAMSLYEVSGVMTGESFLARDLVRGGEPVRVYERSGSKSLKAWDRIGARLIDMDGRIEMAGGVLAFDAESSNDLLGAIKALEVESAGHIEKFRTEFHEVLADTAAIEKMERLAFLQLAAPLFSNVWLADFLQKTLDPKPRKITNSDGEDLVIVTMRFPLTPRTTRDQIRDAFEANPSLSHAGKAYWNWLKLEKPKRKLSKGARQPPEGLMVASTMSDGSTILGAVEIKGRAVLFTTNSRERAAVAKAMIEKNLEGLVKEPVVTEQTPEELMASRDGTARHVSRVELPEEEIRTLVHRNLDEHYRQQLDEPIPMLGNVSPRSAIKTASGRKKVVDWLKTLENHMARVPAGDAMAGYDTKWLWEELGLMGERR